MYISKYFMWNRNFKGNLNYSSHKSPFFKMLAGIYLKFELFFTWSIDQSCIVFILRVKRTLKFFKNAVFKCENIILVAVICKTSTQVNPEKQRQDTLPCTHTQTHTHAQIQGLSQRSWGKNALEYLKICVFFDFRQLFFANCTFKHSEKKQTHTVNLVLASYPQYD